MRRPIAALAALAAAVLGACSAADTGGGAETIRVEHAQGVTEVPANPQRVVVLDYGALDTIDTLGAGDAVVGLPLGTLPHFLADYAGATDVGTMQEPDLEAIAQLDPDLIVVGFRSAGQYPALAENYAVIDVTFDQTDLLAGLESSAGTLAEVFGGEETVVAHLEELRSAIDAAAAKVSDGATAMVLTTSGGEVTANGPGSRFGLIFDLLGFTSALGDVALDSHGEAVSFEAIAHANPDWMFVNDRDVAIGQGTEGQAAAQVLDTPLVTGTTAWAEGNVLYLDGSRWYIAIHGLSNVRAMIGEVSQALGQ